jgi:hypothetical protein
MTIDIPQTGNAVDRSFTVAGWALDLAAEDGSGVDTVDVWAYPATGADPIFLGAAAIGGARPDVAATYGAQFERSSFDLVATGLRAGAYDVVVYAHRSRTNRFDAAQAVRIEVR